MSSRAYRFAARDICELRRARECEHSFVSDEVCWPSDLHELWERIFPCERCKAAPDLSGRIDWRQYVPLKTIGILPPGHCGATYLVLCAEPSGAGRIKDRESSIARQHSPNGVRNFNGTRGDLALQFALERWLINRERGESYYVTDLAKCRAARESHGGCSLRDMCAVASAGARDPASSSDHRRG